MLIYITALALLGLALLALSLRRTYDFFPSYELKRLARGGDHDATILYRAVAYGASLRLLLWVVIGLSVAGTFALFSIVAPAWLSAIGLTLVLWYAFAWAPNGAVSATGAKLAVLVTPAVGWLLYYLHRPLDWLTRHLGRLRTVTFHTGIFERQDLVDLVERQRELSDSRIDQGELDIVLNALSFGEKTVASCLVPKSKVKTVRESDIVGPILMDELYESKHSRFPVVSDDGLSVRGLIFLRSLVAARGGGSVRELMKPSINYVHQNQSLYQVLHAFLTTKHQLFIVIDSAEEYLGIITIEDVIEQIVGHKIEDDFDRYEDRGAVAGRGK